jgi:hypothetical protein
MQKKKRNQAERKEKNTRTNGPSYQGTVLDYWQFAKAWFCELGRVSDFVLTLAKIRPPNPRFLNDEFIHNLNPFFKRRHCRRPPRREKSVFLSSSILSFCVDIKKKEWTKHLKIKQIQPKFLMLG